MCFLNDHESSFGFLGKDIWQFTVQISYLSLNKKIRSELEEISMQTIPIPGLQRLYIDI